MARVELTAVRGGRCAPARNCCDAGVGERGEKGLGASSPRRAALEVAKSRRDTTEREIDDDGTPDAACGGAMG